MRSREQGGEDGELKVGRRGSGSGVEGEDGELRGEAGQSKGWVVFWRDRGKGDGRDRGWSEWQEQGRGGMRWECRYSV